MSKGTVNKAIIIGRLGKDPDMRYAPSGTAIANFSVATNSNFKDNEGNWNEKTEWHNIVTFGRQAEFAGEYLKKGKLVYIEGRLQTSSWEDQNGQKRYKTEILANSLQLLGSKSDGKSTPDRPEKANEQADDVEPDVEESEQDDLPF